MRHICPICQKPVDSDVNPEFPFCSERCRLLDLGNWASEKYVVSQPLFDEEAEGAAETHKRDKDDEEA